MPPLVTLPVVAVVLKDVNQASTYRKNVYFTQIMTFSAPPVAVLRDNGVQRDAWEQTISVVVCAQSVMKVCMKELPAASLKMSNVQFVLLVVRALSCLSLVEVSLTPSVKNVHVLISSLFPLVTVVLVKITMSVSHICTLELLVLVLYSSGL